MLATELSAAGAAEELEVDRVYLEHADFVFRSLQRLGAPAGDLEDLLQEVFVVVHRRRRSFDGSAKLTTWLFGISLRVVKQHRRRARFRREQPAREEPVEARTPEDAALAGQAQRRLQAVLDRLEPGRRAAFVMYEVEGQSTAAIAELMGVPVGTVHSRLHLARRDFRRALERLEQRERRGRSR